MQRTLINDDDSSLQFLCQFLAKVNASNPLAAPIVRRTATGVDYVVGNFSDRVRSRIGRNGAVRETSPGPNMRIVENSSSRLRLRDRTLWISAACFGAAVILAVGAALHPAQPGFLVSTALLILFALAFLRATDVTFDKTTHVCDIRRLDVLRLKRMRFAFADIR